MPWGRLDDGLYDHPKLDLLGRSKLPAVGLWTLSISWSNRRLSDGFIPFDRILVLGGTPALAEALVTAGMFDQADGGYLVHDFLTFNDSRETVVSRREADRNRKRKAAGVQPDSQADSKRTPEPRAPARSRAGRVPPAGWRPDPTRPIPDLLGTTTSDVDARANGEEPSLSKVELVAWRSFGSEWDDFKLAWIGRGLRLPPSGKADDPRGQRAALYSILTERPNDLVRWVGMASGKKSHDVVAWVLAQWHEVQAEVGVDDEAGADGGPGRTEAAESLAEIFGHIRSDP